MHQLTIDHDSKSLSISGHANFRDAHRALVHYVVAADYYLRRVQHTAAYTSYALLCGADLDDPTPSRDPRVTGVATIEELPEPGLPVPTAYFSACEAQRWISDHASKWVHGSAADPGNHYPMAVLTMAHGEAHYYLSAGTLLPEAARLAGADDLTHPGQCTVEALRHNATTASHRPDTPAAIAGAVAQVLPAGVTDHQRAALVWYYALIRWGVSAP